MYDTASESCGQLQSAQSRPPEPPHGARNAFIERDVLEGFEETYVGKRGRPKGYSPKRRAQG